MPAEDPRPWRASSCRRGCFVQYCLGDVGESLLSGVRPREEPHQGLVDGDGVALGQRACGLFDRDMALECDPELLLGEPA